MTIDKSNDDTAVYILTEWFSRFSAFTQPGVDRSDKVLSDIFLPSIGFKDDGVFDDDLRGANGLQEVQDYLCQNNASGNSRCEAVPIRIDSLEIPMGPDKPPKIIGHGLTPSRASPAGRLGLSLAAPVMGQANFKPDLPEIVGVLRFLAGRQGELKCGTVVSQVRLRKDDTADGVISWRAISLFTCWDYFGMLGKLAIDHPQGRLDVPHLDQEWRRKCKEEPKVAIIGGGMAGLSIWVALAERGIPALVIEAQMTSGMSWRRRHPNLHFHQPGWMSSLYNSTVDPSKDRGYWNKEEYANMLDQYVEDFGITISFDRRVPEKGLTWHANEKMWSIDLCRNQEVDGAIIETISSPFLVCSTGHWDTERPRLPPFITSLDSPFPGMIFTAETYSKAVRSSSTPKKDGGNNSWTGEIKDKRAIVIGHGSTGADIANDLCDRGAKVTILARNPIHFYTYNWAENVLFGAWKEKTGKTLADCDFTSIAMTRDLGVEMEKLRMKHVDAVVNKEIWDALERKGVDIATSGMLAHFGKFGGGQYYDPGLNKPDSLVTRIVNGDIVWKKSGTVVEVGAQDESKTGSVLTSQGERIPVDILVFATGYAGIHTTIRRLLAQYPEGLDKEDEFMSGRNVAIIAHGDGIQSSYETSGSHQTGQVPAESSMFRKCEQLHPSHMRNREGQYSYMFRPINLPNGPSRRLWMTGIATQIARSYAPQVALMIHHAILNGSV